MIGEFTLIDNLEQFSGKYAQSVDLKLNQVVYLKSLLMKV